MRVPLSIDEVRLLEMLASKFKRLSNKWIKNCLAIDKSDLFTRNRYEGIARGYKWAAQDLENKIQLGKLK